MRANLAVVQRRHEPPDSLDYFPTPPWATRAFVWHVLWLFTGIARQRIWEPACGEGHMAAVLAEEHDVWASDVFDYGYGQRFDFFDATTNSVPFGEAPDWIITNPPFNRAAGFIQRAKAITGSGVAVLVRTQFLHGHARWHGLFRDKPPTLIAFYAGRVPMHRGRWEPRGKTASDYCWLVWVRGAAPRPPIWIPPGLRRACSRPDDAARFGARTEAPLLEPENRP